MARVPPVAPAFFHQADLLPSAAGARHIAFRTNFGDHRAEVENEIPLHFPRLTAP